MIFSTTLFSSELALTEKELSWIKKNPIVNGYTWSELLTEFENKNIDLMHVMSKTKERISLVIAEKIRKVTEDLTIKLEGNRELKFTISIGVSQVMNDEDINIEASIVRSDEALYEAKESGRNKICMKL